MRKYEGDRNLLDWHYTIGGKYHDKYKLMDLDMVEFCYQCSEPLMLVETTYNPAKATTVLKALAKRAELPAYRYLMERCEETFGIRSVTVKRVWPEHDGERRFSLAELAEWITCQHEKHWAECRRAA